MIEKISATRLKTQLHEDHELALLDVREHGQYGESHLFYAISLPYSRLETDALRLVPRLNTSIVICDDSEIEEGLAALAARRLTAVGYTRISILADGIAGWRRAGFELFKGVNVPSKTFGELVEQQLRTPVITAAELFKRQQAGENLIVLDGRPYEEFFNMSIPGAICCPNGELALRISELADDPETTIVVNCAGRTRSIIGAQTLINLGIENAVMALENGTQGWRLAGHELEHGNVRRHGLHRPAELAQQRNRAAQLAAKNHVPVLTAPQAQALIDDPTRSCYVFDIRTPQEYRRGTLEGAQPAPGGQLIQANDQTIGVRQARLLIVDDEDVRAPVVASWMRQLGFEAYTLTDGINTVLNVPQPPIPTFPAPNTISATTLAKLLAAGSVTLIDIRPSARFRRQHVVGAQWSIRPRILLALTGNTQKIILMATDNKTAQLAILDIQEAGFDRPAVYIGSIEDCHAAGIKTQPAGSPATPEQDIDFLFFVHDRHAGNLAASRRYIDWETGLLEQVDSQELNGFSVFNPAPAPKR